MLRLHHAHLLPAVKSVLDRTKPASDNLWAKYNAMLHDPVVVSPSNLLRGPSCVKRACCIAVGIMLLTLFAISSHL